MKWQAVGPHGAERPVALINDKGLRIGEPPGSGPELPLDSWDSGDHDASMARFNALKKHGVRREHTRHGQERLGDLWRFRGTPHYLDQQGARLGLTKVLTDRARHNPEIYRISTLLGQLNQQYHACRKDETGVPVVSGVELARMEGTLAQCEENLHQLYALTAASEAALDQARAAVGASPAHRNFSIYCVFDEATGVKESAPFATNHQHQHATPAKAK